MVINPSEGNISGGWRAGTPIYGPYLGAVHYHNADAPSEGNARVLWCQWSHSSYPSDPARLGEATGCHAHGTVVPTCGSTHCSRRGLFTLDSYWGFLSESVTLNAGNHGNGRDGQNLLRLSLLSHRGTVTA